jgi:hypothetical protein
MRCAEFTELTELTPVRFRLRIPSASRSRQHREARTIGPTLPFSRATRRRRPQRWSVDSGGDR